MLLLSFLTIFLLINYFYSHIIPTILHLKTKNRHNTFYQTALYLFYFIILSMEKKMIIYTAALFNLYPCTMSTQVKCFLNLKFIIANINLMKHLSLLFHVTLSFCSVSFTYLRKAIILGRSIACRPLAIRVESATVGCL